MQMSNFGEEEEENEDDEDDDDDDDEEATNADYGNFIAQDECCVDDEMIDVDKHLIVVAQDAKV